MRPVVRNTQKQKCRTLKPTKDNNIRQNISILNLKYYQIVDLCQTNGFISRNRKRISYTDLINSTGTFSPCSYSASFTKKASRLRSSPGIFLTRRKTIPSDITRQQTVPLGKYRFQSLSFFTATPSPGTKNGLAFYL